MQTNNSSNQDKPDEFRVGDTVWCLMRGKGEVVMVLTAKDFQHCPILVDFPKTVNPITGEEYTNRYSYSKDGKWSQDYNRTLFFSEPRIEASVTRPFVPTLVGKNVLAVLKTSQLSFGEVMFEDEQSIQVGRIMWKKKDLASIHEIIVNNLLKP